MRDIKFRAWDGEFMFKQADQSDEFMFEFADDGFVLTIQEQYFEMGSGVAEEMWRYIKIDAEFMQYTGLKDKRGVDIYEGDIWQRETFIATVEFTFSQWGLIKTESSSCYQYPSFYSNANTGEVIGNIHEHPELIK